MTTNFLWAQGTNGLIASEFTLLGNTSELASLASGSLIVSSVSGTSGVFNNTNTGQAEFGEVFLVLGSIGSSLSAGANITGWFLQSPDGGTTFESTTLQPARVPDFQIDLASATVASGQAFRANGNGPGGAVELPALPFKVLVLNNTGQGLNASGNSLKCAPFAEQY